jgi:hypothetical protein
VAVARSWWRLALGIAWRTAALLSAAFAIVVAILLVSIWAWWQREPPDDVRSVGVNALWVGHTWVGDAHSDADYAELAEFATGHELSDLFVHAGPLLADGSIDWTANAHAAALVDAMHRVAPAVRVQAYLGQIEQRDGGPLDIHDRVVREGIIDTARRLLDEGFDGIHYDIEPIFPGDDDFLELLERTHALTGERGAVLSVAMEQLEAWPGAERAISVFWDDYHDPTQSYLDDVARRVDQVAIMTYDSGMPTDWLFGYYMAEQTARVVDAIGDKVTVFMGVPTYDDGGRLRFHRSAENMRSGIRGVRKGLARFEPGRRADVGIAVYAAWTTDEAEWATYERDWLGNAP